MGFVLKRVILFSRNVPRLARFYQEVFNLEAKGGPADKDWIELAAGECSLALHKGAPPAAPRGVPKIVFWSEDVEKTREELVRKGARMGRVSAFGDLRLCDGRDPEGNVFQVSNRS
jgi:predicted enzyme related to lactoylglutathione lyase